MEATPKSGTELLKRLAKHSSSLIGCAIAVSISQRAATVMTTIQKQIEELFFEKLKDSKHVDAEQIIQLQKLLAESKKLKADEVAKIFSLPASEEIK